MAIILSLPSSVRRIRVANHVLNAFLFLAILDFLVTPFVDSAPNVVFSRVGAVYPDSVKIVVRYPKANATERLVGIFWREVREEAPWVDGPVLNLTMEHDWVAITKLGGLWPSTTYECRCSLPFVP